VVEAAKEAAKGTAARLVGVEVRLLRLELRHPIGTSAGSHRDRPLLVVRVVTDEAEGWGESGALGGGTSVDPSVSAVLDRLAGGGVARVVQATRARGGRLPEASRLAALYAGTPLDRMAGAVLEMAVLDAELRAAGVPLARRLAAGVERSGTPTPRPPGVVPAGAMVGIPADHDLDSLLRSVESQVARGYTRVRVKIEPGWDVAPLAAVRAAHPDLLLQADANGAYRLNGTGTADAGRLAALDDLELACVEQPLPPGDLAAHAVLAGRLGTPIALDESLGSLRRLADALRYGACAVACLKPSRLGGVLTAERAREACRAAGVAAFVGGFFESGLGRSANAALATLAGFTLPGDLTPPSEYLRADPFAYPEVENGLVRVHEGPGIAPPPNPEILTACTDPGETRWFPLNG
jgi:O-succinylbenzoate synthase